MPDLGLQFTPSKPALRLAAIFNDSPTGLELQMSVLQPPGEPPSPVTGENGYESPLTPLVPSQPVQTPSGEEPFDATKLRKVFPLRSATVSTRVSGASLVIGGRDYSPLLLSFDFSQVLTGSRGGSAKVVLNRDDAPVTEKLGSPVRLSYTVGSETVLLCQGYLVETPSAVWVEDNLEQVTFRIGDILRYRATAQDEARRPYCGPKLRFAGGLAREFGRRRYLGNQVYPQGQRLRETPGSGFLEQDPFSFLQELYAPTDHDVTTDPEGAITIKPRSPWGSATPLNYRETIDQQIDTAAIPPFTMAVVDAKYQTDERARYRTETFESVSNDFSEGNTTPYYLRGPTRTKTKIRYLGGSEVWRQDRVFGYLPVDKTAELPTTLDPCDLDDLAQQGVTFEYGLVKTTTKRVNFRTHNSGQYLVNGSRTQTTGWGSYKTIATGFFEKEVYKLYYGVLDDEIETVRPRTVKDSRVCKKDWPNFTRYRSVLQYERIPGVPIDLGDGFTAASVPILGLVSEEVERYKPDRAQEVEQGESRSWQLERDSGAWNKTEQLWVQQPRQTLSVDPPSTRFLRGERTSINLTRSPWLPALAQEFGAIVSKPMAVPYAYTQDDLVSYGVRYMRDTAGLSNAALVTVSPRVPFVPGQSILYTNKRGVALPYTVWSVEHNQTGQQATQTLMLIREYL